MIFIHYVLGMIPVYDSSAVGVICPKLPARVLDDHCRLFLGRPEDLRGALHCIVDHLI